MPAPVSLPDLVVGARVEGTFLVWDVEQRTQADGNPFVILTLANSTGRLKTAPFWTSDLHKVEGVEKGAALSVIGEIGMYRTDRQLKVTGLRPVAREMVDWAQLLPSVGDVAPWWSAVEKWRGDMADGAWRRAVALFFDDPDFRARYERCPASLANHHAELGGLLKHTVEVGAIARPMAKACGANWDLVLSGVLLHDVGKLEAYRWDGLFAMTEAGSLLGHVVLGSLMLDRRLDEPESPVTSDAERLVLQHLVLSHHGELEFGSPVRPMTLEAEVLHYADLASAATANIAAAIREPANFAEGDAVSKPIWALDRRRVYRGTS
ncbi:MAG TPA: HD domain-containing protein [Gemmatimonadales bacterium]|nr:HD domain-containing protein [Gemmatimonadales bacterium]